MNSAHSYSEGAEVPEDKTHLEKEAEDYADSVDRRGCSFWRGLKMGYIAGATTSIDECIHILETHPGDMNLIPLLESLKNKPI